MVGGTENAGQEYQPDDHVEPLLQYLAVGAGQADQQVGKEGPHDHHPYPFHPQVDGPPAIEDRNNIVLVMQQCRYEQHGDADDPQYQYPFGDGEASRPLDGHANIVDEDREAHDHDQLVRQGLFQQLVASAITEQITDDRRHAHAGPQHQLDIGEPGAVQFGARFIRHQPVGGAHESGDDPDDQQVGVDRLGHVKGQYVQQRVGAEVLGGRQQTEHQLQAEQHHGYSEVPVGD